MSKATSLHASRLAPICAALLIGCQPSDQHLPPVQIEGEILSYAANEEVCEGTVEYGERWMTAVAEQLGISPEAILPTTYYLVDLETTTDRCGGQGCADLGDGEIRIFATVPLNKHELVHAVQFSAWPRRRPLLTEGLAMLFDDDDLHQFVGFDVLAEFAMLDIDIDEQLEKDHAERETYYAGSWIVYWIIERHGIDAFRDFWYADTKDGGAEEFRTLFEQHFGESLDAMLADVEGQPACPRVTCVEDVVEWQGDVWTVQSPTTCDDALTRGFSGPSPQLVRTVTMKVPEFGIYTVSVSDSDLNQNLRIDPCGGPCVDAAQGSFWKGSTSEVVWDAGLYRVTMSNFDVTDPGLRVEVRRE